MLATRAAALACAVLLTPVATAQYTLNYAIADFVDSATFSFTSAIVGDVNAYGHVAFAINEPPAQRGVYVYAGGAPIKIIDDGSSYLGFGRPDINCHGRVAVRGQRAGGGSDMLYFDGGALPVVVLAGNGDSMSDPAINDSDEIVFVQESWGELIYYKHDPSPAMATMAAIADPSDDIASFGPRVDINNAGEIAYGCRLASASKTEIRKIVGGSTCVVFQQSGTAAKNIFSTAINGLGWVGFLEPTDYRVGNCGPTSLLVDNPGGIAFNSPLDLNWHWNCSWGGADTLGGASESGIYGGPSAATDKILRAGQPFPGDPTRIVSPLPIAGGINNRGQVSFLVNFTDGTKAIGRADPLTPTPEPEGCPGLAPGNDMVADAQFIDVGDWMIFGSGFATTDGPPLDAQCEKGYGLSFEADVWFAVVAPFSGCLEVSLCEFATFDTRLAVYEMVDGALGTEQQIACNDDFCGLVSRLVFAVDAGGTYLVRVGGYGGATGQAILTVLPSDEECSSGCGADIDCSGAIDGADLGALLAGWGGPGPGDLDGNGVTDGGDLGQLLANWGG